MEISASTHMSFYQCNFLSITPCKFKSIIVGNGGVLPVSHTGHGFVHLSQNKFVLNDVIIFYSIVKDLALVNKLTKNNNVLISFDSFGFSLMDFESGTLL